MVWRAGGITFHGRRRCISSAGALLLWVLGEGCGGNTSFNLKLYESRAYTVHLPGYRAYGQKASAQRKLKNTKAKGYSAMGVSLSAGQHVSEKGRSLAPITSFSHYWRHVEVS